MQWVRRHYILISIVLFLVAINVLFYFYGPREIVDAIGVENSYLVVFAIAAIGGLSSVTGAVLYTAIATFGAGGSVPWILGLAGGIGIFISDSIFYFLAKIGVESVPEEWQSYTDKIEQYIQAYPRWLVLTFVLLYLSISPLPNDILMFALALAGYQYKVIAPFILIGGISIATLTAYLGNVVWFG